jgi:cell division protein FtsB
MSFTRHVIIFLIIWALLIYIFISKLGSGSTGEVHKLDEQIEKLNAALAYLESSNNLDNELRQLLDEFSNDVVNSDNKIELIKKINAKLNDETLNRYSSNKKLIVPSIEYEQYRRRVGNNILELWNFISSEVQKVEKSLSNNIDAQHSIKQLSNFIELAREHKR